MSKGNIPVEGAATGSVAQEQTNTILPPSKVLPTQQEIRQESGLQDLERDMSEWKADLTAWGSSPVIIPVPAAATETPAEASPDTPEPSREATKAEEPAAPSTADPSTSSEQDLQ
jgi:hypothetical protein